MQFLQQLDPLTIGAAVLALSVAVNLAALGLLVGRGDARVLDLISQLSRRQKKDRRRLRRQHAQMHKGLQKQLGDLRSQLHKLERRQDGLAALQLSQGVRPPAAFASSEDSAAGQARPPAGRKAAARRYSPIDKKHHIYSLARRGVPSQDISRRLRVSRGETELVLGLKQFVRSHQSGAGSAAPAGQELPN